jgi:heme exporter protein D
MILDFFNLNGYGQFVWPSFIFTFLTCFYLFLRTSNELKKQEKLFFAEFKQLKSLKIKTSKIKKREVLSAS